MRNGLVIRAADVVVAVGGAYGTLSEVALALKTGVRVIGLGTWEIEGIEVVDPSTAGGVERWISKGRDQAFEQSILQQIQRCQ